MRQKYRVKWVLALIVALIFSLSACADSSKPYDAPASQPDATPSRTAILEPGEQTATPSRSPDPLPTTHIITPEATAVLTPSPSPVPTLPDGCEAPSGLSQPDTLQAGELGTRKVVRLSRGSDGSSPVPPNFAQDIYAWDNEGGEIGDDEYKAYFTAHTYSSDESALGNQLQANVVVGDLIRVTDTEGSIICYEVTERVEVLESEYIQTVTDHPSQGVIVISVCSGLEGRVWTKRTIWFAQLARPS